MASRPRPQRQIRAGHWNQHYNLQRMGIQMQISCLLISFVTSVHGVIHFPKHCCQSGASRLSAGPAPSCSRIKNPKRSLDFYTRVLGFRLLERLDFPDAKFSLYFLGYQHADAIPNDKAERVSPPPPPPPNTHPHTHTHVHILSHPAHLKHPPSH